jgi:hypothetical protein
MALVLADRVRESTTTTGTGAVTLGGAYTGFQTFLAAVGNTNTTYYTISNVVSGEWEVGIGTYSSGANTLSRTTVLSSSNGGSLVNFTSGAKDVFVTQPAERNVYVSGTSVVAENSATVPNALLANSAVTINGNSVSLGGSTTITAAAPNALTIGTGLSGTSYNGSAAVTVALNTVITTLGGTGLTSYTAGDLPYYATGTALSKLGIGTNGQVLTSNGTAPTWSAASAIAVSTISFGTTGLTPSTATAGAVTVAGTLALANGGTGATTVAGAQTSLQVDPAGTAVAMAIALG